MRQKRHLIVCWFICIQTQTPLALCCHVLCTINFVTPTHQHNQRSLGIRSANFRPILPIFFWEWALSMHVFHSSRLLWGEIISVEAFSLLGTVSIFPCFTNSIIRKLRCCNGSAFLLIPGLENIAVSVRAWMFDEWSRSRLPTGVRSHLQL